jgi:hypothetical protein
MRFSKCIGLFIIVLVVSLNFSGSYLYAERNDTSGNSSSNSNSTDAINDSNIIQLNLTGQVPYYDSLSQLGSYNKVSKPWMAKPVMHTPDWNPPHVRNRHWYNFFGWLWDCIKYGLYCIWYPIEVIGYAIWFMLQMIAWFFVVVVWVPVGLYKCVVNGEAFVNGFDLIFWCFIDDVKYKDVGRIKIINKTVNNNSTNINTTQNSTNKTVNNTVNNSTDTPVNNSTDLSNNTVDVNINEYLLSHHLSSLSNDSLENVTDIELYNADSKLTQQDRNIKKTLLIINTIFEAINNIFSLVSILVDIISGLSAGFSVPTEGGSVPAAVGTQVAKQTGGSVFNNILKGIILESASTMLGNLLTKMGSDKYKVNGGKIIARSAILKERIDKTLESIEGNKCKFKVGKGCFGIVRDIVGMLCSIGELIWSVNYDIEKDIINKEKDYRKVHHLSIS